MCRLAAYLGTEITLSRFLLEPEHSLMQQSWAPKEMRDGTLNADGFGFTWLGHDDNPCTYKNTLPIWSDTNLEGLGKSLSSTLWLANVRGATPGQGLSEANTQPFTRDNLIFTHNGCLKPFDTAIKTQLLEFISNEIRGEINGDSDSLYLFALFKHHLISNKDISHALIQTMADLKTMCADSIKALLNIILSDGKSIYACRHAINDHCPSLYYLTEDNGVYIASEPLSPDRDWQTFSEQSLIKFDRSGLIDSYGL